MIKLTPLCPVGSGCCSVQKLCAHRIETIAQIKHTKCGRDPFLTVGVRILRACPFGRAWVLKLARPLSDTELSALENLTDTLD
jgi:hypothetical protein